MTYSALDKREMDSASSGVERAMGTPEKVTDAKIMIVDDEPINMEFVQVYLENAGYHRFIKIADPEKAILTIQNERPDIILLDLIMPDVSGFDILKEMSVTERIKHIPVIVLTASTEPDAKMKALELGAMDFLSKPLDKYELVARVRNTLSAKAYHDQVAYYDQVTGLPNRSLFMEQLEWYTKLSSRSKSRFAILHVGINGLRRVDHTFGLDAGDIVLRTIGERISMVIRSADLRGYIGGVDQESSVAHFALDQFSIVLPNLPHIDIAALVAKRICQEISQPITINSHEVFLNAYIGIAIYPNDGESASLLLDDAASAMQQARQEEQDCYVFFSSEINQQSLDKLIMENSLRVAIKENQFLLFYQPKVNVGSGKIYGVEALIRWQHPEFGLVGPDRFIAVAEQIGLINDIGKWVIHEACRQLAEWREMGIEKLNVAINISPVQMKSDVLFDELKEALSSYGIPPSMLTIEVTENILMSNVEHGIELLSKIRRLGCRVSIDDFGTGFSSLQYLKMLPIDELKIDRSFIRHAHSDSQDDAIVRAVIYVAKAMGHMTVAEGVEELGSLEFLREAECDLWQGYLCSKPVSSDDLLILLKEGPVIFKNEDFYTSTE